MARPTNQQMTERSVLHNQGLRSCRSCNEVKKLAEFGNSRKDPFGLQRNCKDCTNKRNREVYAPQMSEAAKENRKKWTREWRESLSDDERKLMYRRHNLKGAYGMTLEEFDTLLTSQGGVCAVCHLPMGEGRERAVDHCHETGKIRGILHAGCNTAIGLLNENVIAFWGAIEYLQKHRAS